MPMMYGSGQTKFKATLEHLNDVFEHNHLKCKIVGILSAKIVVVLSLALNIGIRNKPKSII